MKIKFVYQNGPFYYEAECLNEQERKEAIKGLIYATKDLAEVNMIGYAETSQDEPVSYQEQEVLEEPTVEYASDGQKKYMAKLGIPFNDSTTKIEAMDLIKQYKIVHGIPVK